MGHGKNKLNDPIIGHPAMKGRRWMIDYGYDSGKSYDKLNMKYKNFYSDLYEKNYIKGGKGDSITPSDVNSNQLKMGIKVEMEHTNDINIAKEIALDHLKEDPEYYSKLVKSGLADELEIENLNSINEKKKKLTPTNSNLWSRAKSMAKQKFDVYPSAYANAWASKWYKSKGGGWR